MHCLLEFEPFLAVVENFSNVIERDDLALLWRLVELLPIEVRRSCETAQLPMPCRARRVFAVGILRIEKDNSVIRLILAAPRHDEDTAGHTGQDVASTEQTHESGPTGALVIRLRFSRVRNNVERGFVRASWKQVAKGVEGFRVVALFIIVRGCVPRVENHAFRFEGIKRSTDVCLKLLVGQRETERRWLTYSDPVLNFVAIERGIFKPQSVAAILGLHDHRPKLPMDRVSKQISLRRSRNGELSCSETLANTGFATNHKHFAAHDVAVPDKNDVLVRYEVPQRMRRKESNAGLALSRVRLQ